MNGMSRLFFVLERRQLSLRTLVCGTGIFFGAFLEWKYVSCPEETSS